MRKRDDRSVDTYKGKRIKNENVQEKVDNGQLMHYEFTDIEKTFTTIHGERFQEYRRMWDKATGFEAVYDRPLYIVLETNSYCNMKCKMCTRNYFAYTEKIDIPMELVDSIASQCRELGIPSVFVGAEAECLLNPNIKEILKKLKDSGAMDCFLITNAYCLTEEMADFLIDMQYERVYVSLDAATNDTYHKIRGCDLERVEKNLNYLLQQREARGSVLPLVRVSFVIQEENKEEIDAFYQKWKDKVDIIDFQSLIDYREMDQLKETADLPETDFRCVSPFRVLYIDCKGDIYPCCNLYCKYLKIGNIREMTLKEAWNGEKMTQLRQSISDRQYNKVCRNCIAHTMLR